MCKYNFAIPIFLFLLLFTLELFPHGIERYFLFGIKGEYFYQDTYSGMNLNLSIIPKDEENRRNVLLDDFFVLGLNFNQYDKKIRTNFTFCNLKGFNMDTLPGFTSSGEVSVLSFQHNVQINSDISWIKICPGFGYGKIFDSNSILFLGINGGLGISSAYLGNIVNGFGNKDFDGVSILGSALLFYQIDYFKFKIAHDFKSIIWTNKTLFTNTSSLELTFNITKYLNRNYQSGNLLILSAGIVNSTLYYKSAMNNSLLWHLSLFLHE